MMAISALKRLRLIGLLEGSSFLLLLLVAMPLKYLAGRPEAVQVVGAVHGGLWVLFLLAAGDVAVRRRWGAGRVMAAVAASVLPAGPFVFDRSLKQEQESISQPEPELVAGP